MVAVLAVNNAAALKADAGGKEKEAATAATAATTAKKCVRIGFGFGLGCVEWMGGPIRRDLSLSLCHPPKNRTDIQPLSLPRPITRHTTTRRLKAGIAEAGARLMPKQRLLLRVNQALASLRAGKVGN